MRTDELVTAIQLSAFLDPNDDDFDSARLLIEASDALRSVFERAVVNARAGYWLKRSTTTTTAGTAKYRLPHRAVVQGLERLQIAASGGVFTSIPEVSTRQAQEYETTSGTTGVPRVFAIDGDGVRLYPPPDAAYTLRFHYYLRPSRLASQQVSGTERGRVTAVNTSARTVTVNAVPYDQLDVSPPAAITTAVQRIDVLKPNGWHEPVLVGATQTLAGSVFTVGGTDDMSEVEVGDYVRAADQTDWPCLPVDFHRTLALATAARVLRAKGLYDKADVIEKDMAADGGRFADLLTPRVKDSPRALIPRGGPIRRGGARSPSSW